MRSSCFSLLRTLRAVTLLAAIALVVPAPMLAQSATAMETGSANREVPFLTLRNRTLSDDPAKAYGDERSGLSAGWCGVRGLDFGGLAPLAESAPSFVREEFLRVDRVTIADPALVLDDLAATSATTAPALYVHGYYISFEKGCRRAVLFQENADLAGRLLWFSWPSDGSLAYYTHDEADLYWSLPDLADAIIELERRFGPGVVDVVGHSLGARGVVLALHEVANRAPETRLDEIVLLAPDMDFEIFERILPRISPIAENITVYVTTGDKPLALSAQLHGYPRLGEARNDVSALAGAEVIDLSDLPNQDPTGHLYHLYSPDVGADLDLLLNDGLHAAARPNLVQVGPNRWRLEQGDAPGSE